MKIAHQFILLAVLGLSGAAGCRSAHAEQTPDPAPARPSAVPTASAATSASLPEAEPKADRKPWAPTFSGSLPEGSSDPPTKDEWTAAAEALEARITAPDCKARRVREWYRIDCSGATWIDSMVGKREGVSFGCAKSRPDNEFCNDVWVVFPMRRGDRRAFEMFRWGKYGPSPDSIATAYFLDGDALPSISVQGLRWGI
jgi:hypothetical protein